MKPKKSRCPPKDLPLQERGRASARKIKGGEDYKYVAVKRYFTTLEPSVQKETTWTLYGGGSG